MTIAAGFSVSDGFLFCSDTEATSGSLREFRRKVFAPSVGDVNYIYTGAGDADFLQMAADKIKERLKNTECHSVSDLSAVVEDVIVSIHERNIAAYPDSEKPSFTLLIGAYVNGEKHLLRTNATSVVNQQRETCVGSGAAIGNYILSKMWSPADTMKTAALTAIYLLQQTRRHSPHCGGISHIYALDEKGEFGVVSQEEIEAWEKFFDRTECLRSEFISLHGRHSSVKMMRHLLNIWIKKWQKLPEPFSEWQRKWKESS